MTNIVEKFEQDQLARIAGDKKFPNFKAGDTVKVNVKIVEGTTERVQAFEGVCIGRKNRGLNSAFTVRKISHGEGVERTFPLYSPRLESIVLVRSGDVRRAKLYYMRGLTGKAARIKEKQDYQSNNQAAKKDATATAEAKPAKEKKVKAKAETKAAESKD